MKRIPHTDKEVLADSGTAEDYFKMAERIGRFYLKRFLALLDTEVTGERFLEIGPGPGYQTGIIAQKYPNATITAIEPSPEMKEVGSNYIKKLQLNDRVSFENGVVEDSKLIGSKGPYDFIYSSFSLHHWRNPAAALHNLYDALNPGGKILIFDFDRHWLTYHLPMPKGGVIESVWAAYTPKELREMLNEIAIPDYQIRRHFPYLSITVTKG